MTKVKLKPKSPNDAKPLEKYLPEIVYGEDRNYFAPCEIPIYEKIYLELGT